MNLSKFRRFSKYSLFLFCSLIICNTELIKSSDIDQFSRSEKKTANDFDNVFFEYSSSFENYDSYSNQFDNFFGMSYLETEQKRNFQDLSISVDSEKIRVLYEDMLNDLTNIELFKIDNEPIFKKKI